jgi:predicted RNase H-like nuclease (RuvC/YqgF family)
MAAAGLISFGGAFAAGWFTVKTKARPNQELNTATVSQQEPFELPPIEAGEPDAIEFMTDTTKRAMTKSQLKGLIHEVRENMQEYEERMEGLNAHEQRLQLSREMLKKDLEKLNSLRTELASMVARLKNEQEKLLKSQLVVAQNEKANLMSMAAAYDKLDASSAGKILANMCAGSGRPTARTAGDSKSSNIDDAVKILHYMAERTKAEVLAELVTSEPRLTAAICQRLKQIVE